MIRIFITLLVTFNFTIINAQYFWFGGYSPQPCFYNDSIKIIDTVELPEINDYRIATNIRLSSDSIIVNLCYIIAGGPQVTKRIEEVTNIGKLPVGKYTVVIEGKMSNDFSCNSNSQFINSLTFPLEVLSLPNDIYYQSYLSFSSTTSFVNNELKISNLEDTSYIYFYDLQGRSIYRETVFDKSSTINTAGWANGTYIVSVESNGKRKRWKVLKE